MYAIILKNNFNPPVPHTYFTTLDECKAFFKGLQEGSTNDDVAHWVKESDTKISQRDKMTEHELQSLSIWERDKWERYGRFGYGEPKKEIRHYFEQFGCLYQFLTKETLPRPNLLEVYT